jgi:hypothetical protein
VLTKAPERPRRQLTSSVDVTPLLLTIATGSDAWRFDTAYSHIAGRLELASILADPTAPGRPYVLHATDEVVTEFATELYAADAPLHIVALRTPETKYAVYSNWAPGGIEPLAQGQESELYDYTTHAGRLEIHNAAGEHPLEQSLDAQLQSAITDELHAPLPQRLVAARIAGLDDYLFTAEADAIAATARRKRRRAHEVPRHLPDREPLIA